MGLRGREAAQTLLRPGRSRLFAGELCTFLSHVQRQFCSPPGSESLPRWAGHASPSPPSWGPSKSPVSFTSLRPFPWPAGCHPGAGEPSRHKVVYTFWGIPAGPACPSAPTSPVRAPHIHVGSGGPTTSAHPSLHLAAWPPPPPPPAALASGLRRFYRSAGHAHRNTRPYALPTSPSSPPTHPPDTPDFLALYS